VVGGERRRPSSRRGRQRPLAPIRLARQAGTEWPRDPCNVEKISPEGDVLLLSVSYTGGCEEHVLELVARGWLLRDGELHVELLLAHDAKGDACKAIIREQREFALPPLAAACSGELGRTGGRIALHLGPRTVRHRLGPPFTPAP
jgi:hypothetical protein